MISGRLAAHAAMRVRRTLSGIVKLRGQGAYALQGIAQEHVAGAERFPRHRDVITVVDGRYGHQTQIQRPVIATPARPAESHRGRSGARFPLHQIGLTVRPAPAARPQAMEVTHEGGVLPGQFDPDTLPGFRLVRDAALIAHWTFLPTRVGAPFK